MVDIDGSGTIDLDELYSLFKFNNYTVSRKSFNKIFAAVPFGQMNFQEFKHLSKAEGKAAQNFVNMISEAKTKSTSKFFPKQFEYLLKHLQDSSHRQALLQKIHDPRNTQQPEEDCSVFQQIFRMDRSDLSEFYTKQASKINEIIQKRSASHSENTDKLPNSLLNSSRTFLDKSFIPSLKNISESDTKASSNKQCTQRFSSSKLRFDSTLDPNFHRNPMRKLSPEFDNSLSSSTMTDLKTQRHINSLIRNASKKGELLANQIWKQDKLRKFNEFITGKDYKIEPLMTTTAQKRQIIQQKLSNSKEFGVWSFTAEFIRIL